MTLDPLRREKVALVTNMPAPYRLPVFEMVAAAPEIELCVFFCSETEPDRKWKLKKGQYKQVFLREKFITYRGRFIHVNPDIWRRLDEFKPDAVITTGFNPTYLIAYAYARLRGARHIAMTDGTFDSEKTLSAIHRRVRKVVYAGSRAFIGASDGAFALYRSYGIDSRAIFKSHLCADNLNFVRAPSSEKRYDFIFSGRFVPVKNPMFAIEVVRKVAQKLGRPVTILFVGSGEMEDTMRAAAGALSPEIESVFWGFASQEELPALYRSARVFLFPTLWDPWGVVANEACAAGLPVLISPHAGAAGELVRNEENGFVLALNSDSWANAAARLLSEEALYESMSANSTQFVSEYNFENSARGILDALTVQ